VIVDVCFFDNGYRIAPPFGEFYRPHLVVTDSIEYLGVQFINLEKVQFGEHILCEAKLLFCADYSKLVENASFEIREGVHTVGEGIVIEI